MNEVDDTIGRTYIIRQHYYLEISGQEGAWLVQPWRKWPVLLHYDQ